MSIAWSTGACACVLVVTAQTSQYIFVDQALNFADAQAYCESEYQSDLASIHSDADNDAATDLCINSASNNCWIGLHDRDVEDTFVWTDGSDFDYGTDISGGVGPWGNNNPNNWNENEDCVFFDGNNYEYKWSDLVCSQIRSFICNAPTTAAPTQQPSNAPTKNPTRAPSQLPTNDPTGTSTQGPTELPTLESESSTTTLATAEQEAEENNNPNNNENDNENQTQDVHHNRPPINYPLLFACVGTAFVCAGFLGCAVWVAFRRNALAATAAKEDLSGAPKYEANGGANPVKRLSVSRKRLHAKPLQDDRHSVVVVADEQGDDHGLDARAGMVLLQKIQRFCDDAQNDEEVESDDEIQTGAETTKGGANDMQHAVVTDLNQFCNDAENDEEVIGDDDDDNELQYGHTTKGVRDQSRKNQRAAEKKMISMEDVEHHQVEGDGPALYYELQNNNSKAEGVRSSVVTGAGSDTNSG